MTVLGVCNALLPSGERCLGALTVLGEVGDLVEAVCVECGLEAAVPVGKVDEPVRPEAWRQEW